MCVCLLACVEILMHRKTQGTSVEISPLCVNMPPEGSICVWHQRKFVLEQKHATHSTLLKHEFSLKLSFIRFALFFHGRAYMVYFSLHGKKNKKIKK